MPDTPPRSATGTRRKAAQEVNSGAAPKLSITSIQENIANQVTMLGMGVGAADPVGGFIILTNADDFAASWAKVAASNERVKRMLERWFHSGVYAEAGMATATLAVPLLTHYKLFPRAWFNPTAPSVEQIEGLVSEQGKSLSDLLELHRQAEANRAALRDLLRQAAEEGSPAQNGDAPDHFEAEPETVTDES